MREIEFVPAWYVAHSRQKRLVRLHVYVVFTTLLALATWGLVLSQATDAARDALAAARLRLDASAGRVKERQTQQQLRDQLQSQERVDRSLGLNIESSRLIALIDQSMPQQVALTELSVATEERQRTLAQFAAARTVTKSADRRLQVSIKGVAPTNLDVASLYERLERRPFCEDLRLNYSRPRVDHGHVMQEFLVEFAVNLNADGGTP